MQSLRRIDLFALTCALIGMIGFAAGLWHVQRLWPTSDQAIFDYIAFIGNEGGHYYRDAFDISWPAPFLYHALGLAVFGVHSWTFRVTDFLILLPIGLVAMWLFLARCGYRRGAWIAVATYPLLYATSGPWIEAHRDITGMHLLILAAALPIGNRSLKQRGLAGAVLMFATMIRPTYVLAALLLWLVDISTPDERTRRSAAWAAGLITVAAIFLIAGWQAGTIGDWFEQGVQFPAARYQVDESRLRLIVKLIKIVNWHWPWPMLAAIGGALLWRTGAGRRSTLAAILAALTMTVLVSFFAQNKGFPYHASGLSPLMVISAAAGIDAGWQRRRDSAALLIATVGALSVAMAAQGVRTLLTPTTIEVDRLAIAQLIEAESTPEDRILQWGRRYDIAVLSKRRSSTRFINSQLLARISPGDPIFGGWITTFRRELAAKPPAFIIIDREQASLVTTPSSAAAILADLAKHDYVERAVTPEILLLKRR